MDLERGVFHRSARESELSRIFAGEDHFDLCTSRRFKCEFLTVNRDILD